MIVRCAWIVIERPSGRTECVRAGERARIGRVGGLDTNKLVGLCYNVSYRIRDGKVEEAEKRVLEGKHEKRKAMKKSEVFRVVRPSTIRLLDLYRKKRNLSLSHEALAQILFFVGEFPVVVVDGFKGIILAGIAERRGNTKGVYKYDGAARRAALDGEADESVPAARVHQVEMVGVNEPVELCSGLCGGASGRVVLAVATNEGIGAEQLFSLLKRIDGLCDFIVYSPMKETLLPVLDSLLKCEEVSGIELKEFFFREYQPICGMIHPCMNRNGSSGFLLSGTRLRIFSSPGF
jgi:hypothetical protein